MEPQEATPNLNVIWTIPFSHASHPIGDHQNFAMVQDLVYTVFNPYSDTNDCDVVRVYVNKEIWYRMDGEDPDVNLGFKLDGGTTQEMVVPLGGQVKVVAKKEDTILNAQWLGFI